MSVTSYNTLLVFLTKYFEQRKYFGHLSREDHAQLRLISFMSHCDRYFVHFPQYITWPGFFFFGNSGATHHYLPFFLPKCIMGRWVQRAHLGITRMKAPPHHKFLLRLSKQLGDTAWHKSVPPSFHGRGDLRGSLVCLSVLRV